MLQDILEEHLDEAAWLFERRRLAFRMLDMTAADLAEIDARLRAHVDGLILGGGEVWVQCRRGVREGTAGEAFVAGIVAMESGAPDGPGAVSDSLAEGEGPAVEGLRGALELTGWPDLRGFLLEVGQSPSPAARAAALEALTARGLDPGDAIDRGVADPAPDVRGAAARAAGWFGRVDLVSRVEAETFSGEARAAGAALEGLCLLAPARGRARCLDVLAVGKGPAVEVAVMLLGVMGMGEDLPTIAGTLRTGTPRLSRAGLLALGIHGDPGAVPIILDALVAPGLGGVATVALRRMVGGLLELEPVAPKGSPGDEDGPLESWNPDRDLAVYSQEAARVWWASAGPRLSGQGRLRAGNRWRPVGAGSASPVPLMRYEEMERNIASRQAGKA